MAIMIVLFNVVFFTVVICIVFLFTVVLFTFVLFIVFFFCGLFYCGLKYGFSYGLWSLFLYFFRKFFDFYIFLVDSEKQILNLQQNASFSSPYVCRMSRQKGTII